MTTAIRQTTINVRKPVATAKPTENKTILMALYVGPFLSMK